ncbi:MAG TPA: hypothetical protein PKI70_08265 [Mesotoga sp.]|nr:hypothetical protein [Mesotoga sp.]
MIVPAGGASFAAATWKGFTKLRSAGIIDKVPRILIVKAEGCVPVVRAFRGGSDRIER